MSDDKSENEKNIQGHEYDGITELDNPLPGWWLWTFFIAIIFSFLYYIHYEFANGPSLKQELTAAMEELEKNKAQTPDLMETEDTLASAMNSKDQLSLGAAVFMGKCSVCHGAELQGQIGPNLTDKYWLHGKGTRADLIKVIRQGVLEKGMPNWDQLLSKDELYAVTAYIYSKKGSNPPNAKAPQGNSVD